MGISISWIAVHGKSKDAVLAELDLVDTGVADRDLDGDLSVGCSEDGWVVIVSNDLEYVTPGKLQRLSQGATAIGCLEEEHVMFSGARCFVDGAEAWAIVHESEKGLRHLHVEGEPPKQFAGIRSRALRKQHVEDPRGKLVDYIYDIPPKTAAAVCKVRPHGLGRRALRYTIVKSLNADQPVVRRRIPWWRRLLAPLRGTAGR